MNPLAIAHRAGNSVAGLHGAYALGVDVIECDVHHHRGRLEVRHDKPAGPLSFLWGRRVSATAPRLGLRELLDADRHGTTFMLDLKGRRSATGAAVADLLHDLGTDRPVLACGRYWPSVEQVAALPFVQPVLSARTAVELARLRQRLLDGPPVHGVSLHRPLLDEELVSWLHQRVEVVMTWPVRDPAELDDVLRLGVSGVISDDQDVLAAVVDRRPH